MATAVAPLQSINPATLQPIGDFEPATPEEIEQAVAEMRASHWPEKTIKERVQGLRRLKALLAERAEDFALAITRSTGKPLVEAYSSELFPVAYLLDYFLKFGPGMLRPQKVPLPLMKWGGRRSEIEFRPVGVVGIISPWNYPFSIPVGEAIIGLLAGCTIVVKPSEVTPLVGKKIADLFRAADLPVRVLQGGGTVGASLIQAKPDKIIFTGGTATGRRIMEAAAKHLIPVVLELGGKDPMIVDADAHIENASDAAVWGCFTNSGQVCASVKRLLVVEEIADKMTEAVVRKAKALRMGDPMNPATDIGSLTCRMQLDRVEEQAKSALREGATLACGGHRRDDLGGLFFEPTVFTDVTPSMQVAREEIFGPVLPILRVCNIDEAVAIANDSPFGLTASVFSRRRGRAIARRLQAGTVIVNDCTYTHALPETPWGGVKESGFGRTHGHAGLMEFVHPFHINENTAPDRRSLWWFPYDAEAVEIFRQAVRWSCAEGAWDRIKGLRALAKPFSFSRLKPRP